MRILHTSDLHFGWPAVLEQADAVERLAQREQFDVIAVSGDFSQRARAGEFQRAAVFLRDLRRPTELVASAPELITVPGNHDVAWWFAPFGIGDRDRLYAKYRRYISDTLEPELHLPGATFVGLNTAPGVQWYTLTANPRDLSVTGALRPSQLARAAAVFAHAPPGDARIVVMHHNPMLGELSQRRGLLRSRYVLGAFARAGVDLVLCGHDHQESVHFVEATPKGTVISTAGTLSSRSRGDRPASVNIIELTSDSIRVETRVWTPGSRDFEPAPVKCFAR